MHGRHGATVEAAERAVDYYRRSGWPVSVCFAPLASALKNGPTPVPEAIRRCRSLLTGGDLAGRANVMAPLGGLEAMRNRFKEARSLIAEARSLYEQLGQASTAEANCGSVAARIELLAGDASAAERIFRSTCDGLERVGDQAYLATGAAELADVLLLQERDQEADHWCLLAEQLGASHDVLTQVLWRSVRARLLARQGDSSSAEQLARIALGLAEDTDDVSHRAKVQLDLAEVLRLAARPQEAGEAVEQAIELFERKGNIVAAKRSRALLSELAPA